jgi:hypothetical protein
MLVMNLMSYETIVFDLGGGKEIRLNLKDKSHLDFAGLAIELPRSVNVRREKKNARPKVAI